MEKIIKQGNIAKLKLEIEANAIITISPTTEREVKVVCEFTGAEIEVSEKKDDTILICKIKDPNQNKKNLTLFSERFGEQNVFSFFSSLNNVVKKMQELKVSSELIKVAVYLPINLNENKILINNGKIQAENIKLNKFKVEGNNTDIKISKNSIIEEIKLNLNNCKIKLPLNEFTKLIKIETNNSKIKLYRTDKFLGKIKHKGNNCTVKGIFDGDENMAVVKIYSNNSDIKVIGFNKISLDELTNNTNI